MSHFVLLQGVGTCIQQQPGGGAVVRQHGVVQRRAAPEVGSDVEAVVEVVLPGHEHFQRVEAFLLGSLIDAAEIISKVWICIGCQQDLHHTGVPADGCHHESRPAQPVPRVHVCAVHQQPADFRNVVDPRGFQQSIFLGQAVPEVAEGHCSSQAGQHSSSPAPLGLSSMVPAALSTHRTR